MIPYCDDTASLCCSTGCFWIESPKESRISSSIFDEISRGFQFHAKFCFQPIVFLLRQEIWRHLKNEFSGVTWGLTSICDRSRVWLMLKCKRGQQAEIKILKRNLITILLLGCNTAILLSTVASIARGSLFPDIFKIFIPKELTLLTK